MQYLNTDEELHAVKNRSVKVQVSVFLFTLNASFLVQFKHRPSSLEKRNINIKQSFVALLL